QERDFDSLARRGERFGNLDPDTIRRLLAGRGLAAPAGEERVGSLRAVGAFGQHQLIVASVELSRRCQRATLPLGDARHALLDFDDLARLPPLPGAACLAIPVILPVDAYETPVDYRRLEGACPVDRYDL